MMNLSTYLHLLLKLNNPEENESFKIWIEVNWNQLDFGDISKYDRMICDMPVVGPTVEDPEVIQKLESEPMPLYLVSEEKRERYEILLYKIIAEYNDRKNQ